MPPSLHGYREVQAKARRVLDRIVPSITSESTELQIAQACLRLLKAEGVTETWYYEVPALVLLGSRSCLSVSGRDYTPATEPAGDSNLVTIDLSPRASEFWGDCARSYVIENGVVTTTPIQPEFAQGLETQRVLHRAFKEAARPDKTFEEVADEMNALIADLGYQNLDFLGNLGHSIVKRREDRIYFEKGNLTPLKDVDYFTFEPHIRWLSGRWGFKHEEIYFFDRGSVAAL